ncbi:MAG TPA: hypothetical protein VLL75_23045 [Vicinamibacteria bacterium]|nr:hypothetical protein [Vicinamibacteria bacterium]
MPPALIVLLVAAPPALHEQAFHLDEPAEVVATVTAGCEGCDWGVRGREAAVLSLAVDGSYSQHVVLFRGESADYRVLLGPLPRGEHRLSLSVDARRSAPAVGPVRVGAVAVSAAGAADPEHEARAHAPILHARRGSVERFTDFPLLAWVEARPTARGRELSYSVVFSHEDGGTPAGRLMATWGRVTDIELVYTVELDATGVVLREEYQGRDHEIRPFRGRKVGRHPALHVVTENNMVSDRGPSTPRLAPAPVAFSLDGVSREAVMDAHPWTYRVSAQEVRREGRVATAAAPGSVRIPDPRLFAYLEACGTVEDARLAFDLGLLQGDRLAWFASDVGGADSRVGRSGCFRAAIALPPGAPVTEVRAVRFRAHTRPSGKGEPPLSRGSGSARLDRVNRLFGLGADDLPLPSVFSWQGPVDLRPDGGPVEVPFGPVGSR